MAQDLTRILRQKVGSPASLATIVSMPDQAILAGRYLYLHIVDAELRENPYFCEKGVEMLKRWYNSLCSKFPELATQVHEPYELCDIATKY